MKKENVKNSNIKGLIIGLVTVVLLLLGTFTGAVRERKAFEAYKERYAFRALHWNKAYRYWDDNEDEVFEKIYDRSNTDGPSVVLWSGAFDGENGSVALRPIQTLIVNKGVVYGVVELRNEREIAEIEQMLNEEFVTGNSNSNVVLQRMKEKVEQFGDWEKVYKTEIDEKQYHELLEEIGDSGVIDSYTQAFGPKAGRRIALLSSDLAYGRWINGPDSSFSENDGAAQYRDVVDSILEQYLIQEFEVTNAEKVKLVKDEIKGMISEWNVWIDKNYEKRKEQSSNIEN